MIKRLPEGTENKASKGFLYLIGGFVFLDISSIRDLAPGGGYILEIGNSIPSYVDLRICKFTQKIVHPCSVFWAMSLPPHEIYTRHLVDVL